MKSKGDSSTPQSMSEVRRVMIKVFRRAMAEELEIVSEGKIASIITSHGTDKVALVPLRYLEVIMQMHEFGDIKDIFDDAISASSALERLKSLFKASFFRVDYPQQYAGNFNNARDVCMIGTTLRRIFPAYRKQLETIIRGGGTVKAILVDPDNDAVVKYAMMHTFNGKAITQENVDAYKGHINTSIQSLVELRNQGPGKVHICTIDNPLSCGIDAIDRHQETGVIYVRQFQFETEDLPMFEITPKDGKWYRFYCDLVDHHIHASDFRV